VSVRRASGLPDAPLPDALPEVARTKRWMLRWPARRTDRVFGRRHRPGPMKPSPLFSRSIARVVPISG